MARGTGLAAVALVAPLVATLPAPSLSAQTDQPGDAPAPLRAALRVNDQGWLPRETKQATLMTSRPIGATTFAVVGHHGKVFLRGTVPSEPVGRWSGRFPDVYRIDLSPLRTRGRYRLQTYGAVRTRSRQFRVAGPADL